MSVRLKVDRDPPGGYGGLDFGMVDSSAYKDQVSTKAGQLQMKNHVSPI